jgi:hypothetical protein
VHLRDPVFERVLWCDAICINQQDEEEKVYQVGSMAKIYGFARRVVVWLGEEGEDSALAFRDFNEADLRAYEQEQRSIRILAAKGSEQELLLEEGSPHAEADESDCTRHQRAFLALFNRPYFRRIWVSTRIQAERSLH